MNMLRVPPYLLQWLSPKEICASHDPSQPSLQICDLSPVIGAVSWSCAHEFVHPKADAFGSLFIFHSSQFTRHWTRQCLFHPPWTQRTRVRKETFMLAMRHNHRIVTKTDFSVTVFEAWIFWQNSPLAHTWLVCSGPSTASVSTEYGVRAGEPQNHRMDVKDHLAPAPPSWAGMEGSDQQDQSAPDILQAWLWGYFVLSLLTSRETGNTFPLTCLAASPHSAGLLLSAAGMQ